MPIPKAKQAALKAVAPGCKPADLATRVIGLLLVLGELPLSLPLVLRGAEDPGQVALRLGLPVAHQVGGSGRSALRPR